MHRYLFYISGDGPTALCCLFLLKVFALWPLGTVSVGAWVPQTPPPPVRVCGCFSGEPFDGSVAAEAQICVTGAPLPGTS